jgi:geranylgeranyl pyrophosphate synthase
MTLPMIHFLRNAPVEHRTLLRSLLESRDADKAERVRNLILPSTSILYAKDLARSMVERARAELAPMPETDAKHVLDAMAEFVITRPM